MELNNGGLFEQVPDPVNGTQFFAGANNLFSETQNGVVTFVGLEGPSQREGYRRIFPTLDMTRYVEIAEENILRAENLSAAQSPFGTLGGTRISVREATPILTSKAVSQIPEIDDEFDLDIRLGAASWSFPAGDPGGFGIQAKPDQDSVDVCKSNGECGPITKATCKTCETCHTCKGEHTCATCKGEHTCHTCKGEHTCHTCKGEATCATCKGDATCATCEGQATCHTCAAAGCILKTETCCKDTCV